MPEDEEGYEVVVVDPGDVDYLREVASENAVEATPLPQAGFEPITTLTFALMGSAFAVATVLYLVDRRKGGQVIDLRPGATKSIYRSTEVVYGLVVIIALDGSVRIEVREPKGMFGAVNELVVGLVGELGGKDVKAVAQVVTQHVPQGLAAVSAVEDAS